MSASVSGQPPERGGVASLLLSAGIVQKYQRPNRLGGCAVYEEHRN